MKLNNKYVIGVHVMFFEIEMFREYVDGIINLIQDVENTKNIYLDFCFNTAEHIEQIDTNKITKKELKNRFNIEAAKLEL